MIAATICALMPSDENSIAFGAKSIPEGEELRDDLWDDVCADAPCSWDRRAHDEEIDVLALRFETPPLSAVLLHLAFIVDEVSEILGIALQSIRKFDVDVHKEFLCQRHVARRQDLALGMCGRDRKYLRVVPVMYVAIQVESA